jgi:hypothetical protein
MLKGESQQLQTALVAVAERLHLRLLYLLMGLPVLSPRPQQPRRLRYQQPLQGCSKAMARLSAQQPPGRII